MKNCMNTTIITRLMAFLMVFLMVSLLACGGSKKALISQSDINSAANSGTLAALYDKTAGLLKESRGSSKEDLMLVQSNIAKLLVGARVNRINEVLAGKKTEFDLIDQETLSDLEKSIQGMTQWNPNKYKELHQRLAQAIGKTASAIDEANANANKTKSDVVLFLKWKKKVAILSGPKSKNYASYTKERATTIDRLANTGRDAFEKRMFNLSLRAAEQGRAIDPGNIQFDSLLSQSQASLFEQAFRSSLENGKPESAYQALLDIADKPIMQQIQRKMKKNILLLSNYFAGNAKTAYGKGELYAAYNDFRRGRDIQKKLSVADRGFIQEKQYLDLLMDKTEGLQGNPGVKFGLLSVVKEFDPRYPSLEEKLIALSEQLSKRATTKLAVSEFREVLSSNSVVASVGRRVSSKLEKILFDQLGGQLQIVAELISTANAGGYSGVALAIDGEVLQAAIETSKNRGQRTINVQTAINKTETEAYVKWKKRKRGDQPTQFDETKIMEDVTIHTENIKKLAVAEVAYRIIEPSTQKVLLTNNVTKEAQHSGTSTNEFQKGMFHQPYVDAALPSEIKIMDDLARQLSLDLGQTLLTYLAAPEKVFYQKHKDAIERGEIIGGIEYLSNAIVLAQNKDGLKATWLAELKKLVLEQTVKP